VSYGDFGHSAFSFNNDAPLRGILRIAIIDLIKDKSAHGGEIYQSLKEKFQIDTPRGIIYTLLRRMEGEGLILSNWDIQESGPARRIYRITEDGLEYLKNVLERLKKSRKMINILLREH
jgi:PadR family transcriptional regulator, regulatory protein PadR